MSHMPPTSLLTPCVPDDLRSTLSTFRSPNSFRCHLKCHPICWGIFDTVIYLARIEQPTVGVLRTAPFDILSLFQDSGSRETLGSGLTVFHCTCHSRYRVLRNFGYQKEIRSVRLLAESFTSMAHRLHCLYCPLTLFCLQHSS